MAFRQVKMDQARARARAPEPRAAAFAFRTARRRRERLYAVACARDELGEGFGVDARSRPSTAA